MIKILFIRSTNWNLLSAIDLNCFTDKRSSTVSVLINVVRKALVRYIHLTETCQYFVCTKIVILGDMVLQHFYKVLCFSGIRTFILSHAECKLCHNMVHSRGKVIPLLLGVILGPFCVFLVCIRFAPFFFALKLEGKSVII